jgi:GAF domain-containing protein/DNA-binding CsgD family transcriptional regulator
MGNFAQLSERQLQVAERVANGYSNREIASELKLTEQIVKNVIHSVFDRLGVWNRVELASRFLTDRPRAVIDQIQSRIEAERLVELRRRQILDTKAEQVFDELTTLAVKIFDVPIALVAFMDSNRLWFKSNIGLDVSQVPRELTICHHTIQQSEVLALCNAPQDARFVCNPLVQEVGVQFYAAAPILTDDGYPLGVVCVVDRVPRQFSTAHLSTLTSLARLALRQTELRLELQTQSVGDHVAKGTQTMSAQHDDSIDQGTLHPQQVAS